MNSVLSNTISLLIADAARTNAVLAALRLENKQQSALLLATLRNPLVPAASALISSPSTVVVVGG